MTSVNRFEGVAVSRGVAIGPVRSLEKHGALVHRRVLTPGQTKREAVRFHDAVARSRHDIECARQALGEDAVHLDAMFDAFALMHSDALLVDATVARITQQHVNVEWALEQTIDELKAPLLASDSPYFRARAQDMDHLQDHLLRHLRGEPPPSSIDDSDIVLAYDLSPADAVRIFSSGVGGVVTRIGGPTSHTAILARTFGVPTIVGIERLPEVLDGTIAILDGFSGVLTVDPDTDDQQKGRNRLAHYRRSTALLEVERDQPSITPDGHPVTLTANVELPTDPGSVIDAGAEGIGLFRTEFLCVAQEGLPSEAEQALIYRQVASAVFPKPVVFRTFDWAGDKRMLLRGVSAHWSRARWFRTQVRAIISAADVGNVRVMFPMLSSVSEFEHANAIVDACHHELVAENDTVPKPLVGAMVEVPSAVMQSAALAARCDFLSIGSNDLTQYALALDRLQPSTDKSLPALHPAVLALIKSTLDAAGSAKTPCSLCGDMAADPIAAVVALGLGCRELSVPPNQLDLVRAIVRRVAIADALAVAHRALRCASAAEVRHLVVEQFRDKLRDVWEGYDLRA